MITDQPQSVVGSAIVYHTIWHCFRQLLELLDPVFFTQYKEYEVPYQSQHAVVLNSNKRPLP